MQQFAYRIQPTRPELLTPEADSERGVSSGRALLLFGEASGSRE
jgi:hypothetical protein